MIITYERPDTLEPDWLDPAAPPTDLSPTGAECGRVTYDVGGLEWRCTRPPHPGDDEHRAAFERNGNGPEGAVGFAWTHQYATDEPNDGIDHAAPPMPSPSRCGSRHAPRAASTRRPSPQA